VGFKRFVSYVCLAEGLKEHQHDFNIIHFPECQGLGFYSLLAKHQGIAFANTTFIVGTHGPTFWVKDQAGAIEYLRGDGRLAVISSLADNFPNTVLECVGVGVPFLASDVGGIPEI
jgi:glycosyltransferase involved in cell wall biosynthesis